jgi:hypothetical protein
MKSREIIEWNELRESLSFALVVNDYRDFLGMSKELIDDERLLEFMYKTRGNPKFVQMKGEGKAWYGWHNINHWAEHIPSIKNVKTTLSRAIPCLSFVHWSHAPHSSVSNGAVTIPDGNHITITQVAEICGMKKEPFPYGTLCL